jgi:hypothetical protein
VYRGLVKGADNTLVKAPSDSIIKEIAEQLATDEAVIRSIRRYDGRDLIWFGEWTAPDGVVHTGGSNKTIAYKKASAILRDRVILAGGISNGKREGRDSFPGVQAMTTKEKVHSDKPKTQNQNRSGCLSLLLLGGIILIGIVFALIAM